MERVQLSMDVAQMVEQTTRQDIRKWVNMPENPIGKKIKIYAQEGVLKKKMKQSTLMLLGDRRTGVDANRGNKDERDQFLHARSQNRDTSSTETPIEEQLIEIELMEEKSEENLSFNAMHKSTCAGAEVESVDSWEDTSEYAKIEYELNMESEEGWNLGLSDLLGEGDGVVRV